MPLIGTGKAPVKIEWKEIKIYKGNTPVSPSGREAQKKGNLRGAS